MSMSSAIDAFLQSIKVQDEKVREQANDYLRMIDVKIRAGSLDKGDICRPAVAVVCAMRKLKAGQPTEPHLHAGVKEDVFRKTLTRIEQALDIREEVTLKSLGVKYDGLANIVPKAEQLLQEKIDLGGNVSDPVYAVVAYIVAAKELCQENNLQKILCAEYNIESTRFREVASMLERKTSMESKDLGAKRPPSENTGANVATLKKRKAVPVGPSNQSAQSSSSQPRQNSMDLLLRNELSACSATESSLPPQPKPQPGFPYISPDDTGHDAYLQWKFSVLEKLGRVPLPFLDHTSFLCDPTDH